jgi:hypothetical protein
MTTPPPLPKSTRPYKLWIAALTVFFVVPVLIWFAYTLFRAVYPDEDFYRDLFAQETGLAVPPSARFLYSDATFPDTHGDFTAAMLFEVSPQAFDWLKAAAPLNGAIARSSITPSDFRDKAEKAYGKPLNMALICSLKERVTDRVGNWALLDDNKTVYAYIAFY